VQRRAKALAAQEQRAQRAAAAAAAEDARLQHERELDEFRPAVDGGAMQPQRAALWGPLGGSGQHFDQSPPPPEAERRAAREALLAAVPVRERAEMRKRLQQEQEEEDLRQARITAAAERYMC
jgi:hypothetical protein